MTTETATPLTATRKPLGRAASVSPALVLIAAWLIPGAGHLLLRKWTRAVLLAVSIVCMFAIGVALKGKIYNPGTGELLDMLGFAGDLGAGALTLLARMLDLGQAPVQIAIADYGTKFIVVAGLLNVICAVDAHSLATGRKAS